MVTLVLIFTFAMYGGLHLLAWQYQFQTRVESALLKAALIATASSGLITVLVLASTFKLTCLDLAKEWRYTIEDAFRKLAWLVIVVVLVARSFLIVECVKALPNSPASVYEIPTWTAYVPHL